MNNSQPRIVNQRGPTWFSQVWWGADALAARQYTLLRMLALAYRERLDIVPLLQTLSSEHRGFYRHALNALATRIENGATLVNALEQTPDALRDEDVLALRLAGESGMWNQTFEDLLRLRLEDQRGARVRPRFSITYWLVLLLVFAMIMALMMGVVTPTFLAIGREMGFSPPPAFVQLMLTFGQFKVGYLMLLLVVGVLWFTWFRAPRRFFIRQVAPHLLPPVAEHQIVELYRQLAVALDAGRPIPGAISTLARYHFNRRLRHRLLFARNEIEHGADVWHSLARARLIRPREAELLAQSPDSKIAAWSLRELARKKLALASRRTAAVATLVEPIITLCFGAWVLWVCFAFFQYLVSFTTSLT